MLAPGWFRDKVLPVILTSALVCTAGSGLLMWREMAVMNVKLDVYKLDIDDLKSRVRELEKDKHEHRP